MLSLSMYSSIISQAQLFILSESAFPNFLIRISFRITDSSIESLISLFAFSNAFIHYHSLNEMNSCLSAHILKVYQSLLSDAVCILSSVYRFDSQALLTYQFRVSAYRMPYILLQLIQVLEV